MIHYINRFTDRLKTTPFEGKLLTTHLSLWSNRRSLIVNVIYAAIRTVSC